MKKLKSNKFFIGLGYTIGILFWIIFVMGLLGLGKFFLNYLLG